jgi:putative ABC transport system ATP-binding protein
MVEVKNLTKTYHKYGGIVNAVANLNCRFEEGRFSVVYGKSGSGKSTLLMTIGGMMTPTEGQIIIGNDDVYALSSFRRNLFRRKSVGFIFQKFLLLPYFTVYNNIALPLAMSKSEDYRGKILKIAESLGLSNRINHYPYELSVGQQQRVAMARVLVKNPDIILADEPTGNLDKENREIIVSVLLAAKSEGKTVIAATHDEYLLNEADNSLHLEEGRAI